MKARLTDYASDALDCILAVERADSLDSLAFEVSRTLQRFGFEHFVVMRAPAAGEPIESAILLSRLPKGWEQVYSEGAFLEHDPVYRHCQIARDAFVWSQAPQEAVGARPGPDVMSAARRYGMNDGICLPVRGISGVEGCASLSGGAPDLNPRVRPLAHFVAAHAYMRCRQLWNRDSERRLLSPREREVLTWAARGYSACRTATLLGIAERTVTAHVVSACDKLRAANKTAAVAQALQRGLISL